MYYIINPFVWPFTIIPNLPQNLIEVIDSPIPLLIGMLGDKKLAKDIHKMRGGRDDIIIIDKNKLKYYMEDKINFSKKPLENLYNSLKINYAELQFDSQKNNKDDYQVSCEKIYKNIYGAIKNELCSKIDSIAKKYKQLLEKNSNIGKSDDILKNEELEVREKIKDEFLTTFTENKNKKYFYKIFVQTQIFASYLDSYIETQ